MVENNGNKTVHALLAALLLTVATPGCKPHQYPTTFPITASGQTYSIKLEDLGSGKHLISSFATDENKQNLISEWKLDYPVFNFASADVDENGTNDILIGVIKKTKYDSTCRKRIFIFKVLDGHIRPLWLGSRMSQPLEDFKATIVNNSTIVRTIEIEQNGNYLVAEYKWKGFGLSFLRYITRNVDISAARKQF